jgi:hypothetical protein
MRKFNTWVSPQSRRCNNCGMLAAVAEMHTHQQQQTDPTAKGDLLL